MLSLKTFFRIAALFCCLPLGLATVYSDDRDSLVISPPSPKVDQAFTIKMILPNIKAFDIVSLEPEIVGQAEYVGVDIKQSIDMNGIQSANILWTFIPSGEGLLSITLYISVQGVKKKLPECKVPVASDTSLVLRYGNWLAPSSVYQGQIFTIKALSPDKSSISSTDFYKGFSVKGGVFHPHFINNEADIYAVILKPTTIELPQISFHDKYGQFEIPPKSIKALPKGDYDAIGSSLKIDILEPKNNSVIYVGQSFVWDARLKGLFWPSSANIPKLSIAGPDGFTEQLDGTSYTEYPYLGSPDTVLGQKGVINSFMPKSGAGVYNITMEPYHVFDVPTGKIVKISSPSIKVNVVVSQADSKNYSHALDKDLEDYVKLLKLKKSAFPPFNLQKMIYENKYFSNIYGYSYVLLPYGWIGVCLVLSALISLIALLINKKHIAIISIIFCSVFAILFAISITERLSPRFVSVGGIARNIPSELATYTKAVKVGQVGKVLKIADKWCFVNFEGSAEAAWVEKEHIIIY